MRKTFIIGAFFLISLQLSGQERYFPIFLNQKWGAVNGKLEIIIPPNYDDIKFTSFSDRFVVCQDSKWGVIDTSLNEILPIQYDSIQVVQKDIYLTLSHKAKTLFNTRENSSFSFDPKADFSWFTGKLYILKSIPDSLTLLNITDFSQIALPYEKISVFKIQKKKKTLFQYVDDDKTYYSVFRGDKKGLLDNNFNIVIPCEYEEIAFYLDFLLLTKDGYLGLADFSGKIQIPTYCQQIIQRNIFWHIKSNGWYGLLDNDFKTILPIEYSTIKFNGNNLIAGKDNMEAVFDKAGNKIIPFLYNSVNILTQNYFVVSKDEFDKNNTGVINKRNTQILPLKFFTINLYENKYFLTSTKSTSQPVDLKYGVYNLKGRNILPDSFQHIQFSQNFFIAKAANEFYYIFDSQGKRLYHTTKQIFPVNNSNLCFMPVKNHKKEEQLRILQESENPPEKILIPDFLYGVINCFGEILLDTLYFKKNINIDFETLLITAKTDTGAMIVRIEEDGRLIDKLFYKNYIFIEKDNNKTTLRQPNGRMFQWVRGTYTPSGKIVRNRGLWGLEHIKYNLPVIDYAFHDLVHNFNNDTALVLTIRENYSPSSFIWNRGTQYYSPHKFNNVYGLANDVIGKNLLPCVYVEINANDFTNGPLARCISTAGTFTLVQANGKRKFGTYHFVDDMSAEYIRVNRDGRFVSSYPDRKSHGINSENVKYRPLFINDTTKCAGMNSLSIFKNMSMEGGMWGAIDKSGNKKVRLKYDYLEKFIYNQFIACKNNVWGVIDEYENELIPFVYDEIRFFTDDRDFVMNYNKYPYYKICLNEKWGIIDSQNNAILPCKYNDIQLLAMKDDVAFAVQNKNKNWGAVNLSGDTIIPLKFDFIYSVDTLLSNFIIAKSYEREGFINIKNKKIHNPDFKKVFPFNNGFAGMRNLQGKYQFINKEGQVIPGEYDDFRDFSNNRAAVKSKKKWGYINELGDTVISHQFIDATSFDMGRAMVRLRKRHKLMNKTTRFWGIIDTTGKWLVRPKFYDVGNSVNGLFSVYKKGWGVLDSNNNWVIKPKTKQSKTKQFNSYTYISEYNVLLDEYGYLQERETYAPVAKQSKNLGFGYSTIKNKHWAIVDTTGNYFIRPVIDKFTYYDGNMLGYSCRAVYFLFDNTGNQVVPYPCRKITKEEQFLIIDGMKSKSYMDVTGSRKITIEQ